MHFIMERVLLKLGALAILSTVVIAQCPPLQPPQGMVIECMDKNNGTVDCLSPSVPKGVIGQYRCANSSATDWSNSTLKCICRGRWKGVDQFNIFANSSCGALPMVLQSNLTIDNGNDASPQSRTDLGLLASNETMASNDTSSPIAMNLTSDNPSSGNNTGSNSTTEPTIEKLNATMLGNNITTTSDNSTTDDTGSNATSTTPSVSSNATTPSSDNSSSTSTDMSSSTTSSTSLDSNSSSTLANSDNSSTTPASLSSTSDNSTNLASSSQSSDNSSSTTSFSVTLGVSTTTSSPMDNSSSTTASSTNSSSTEAPSTGNQTSQENSTTSPENLESRQAKDLTLNGTSGSSNSNDTTNNTSIGPTTAASLSLSNSSSSSNDTSSSSTSEPTTTPSSSSSSDSSSTTPSSVSSIASPSGVASDDSSSNSSTTVGPENLNGTSGGNGTVKEFQTYALDLHNKIRMNHNAQPLTLNDTLNNIAQSWAETLLANGKLMATPGKRLYAENLFKISGGTAVSDDAAVDMAMKSWSSAASWFNYTAPKPTGFSQIVWNTTTQLGFGIASGNDTHILVATYYPRGNIVSVGGPTNDPHYYFKKNVFPEISNPMEVFPSQNSTTVTSNNNSTST